MLLILAFLSFIKVSIAASSFHEVKILKSPDSPIAGENFFRVNNNFLLTNIEINEKNQQQWEKVFGKLTKKTNKLFNIPASLISQSHIHEGMNIHFFNTLDNKVSEYIVPKNLKACLMNQAGDDPLLYNSFVLAIADQKECLEFGYSMFDSIAISGNRFHISSKANSQFVRKASVIKADEDEIKLHLQQINKLSKSEADNLKIFAGKVGDKHFYAVKIKNEDITFVRTSENSFLKWQEPDEDGTYIDKYSTWIDEAALTAVLNVKDVQYLLIFKKNELLKFKLTNE